MKVLVVLQNAWRRGAVEGEIGWSADPNPRKRAHWERALWASQTGKRLREMIPSGADVRVINASPYVGGTAASVFKPDIQHVNKEITDYMPHVVVLCGRVAERIRPQLADLPFRILTTPHPAWRLLSKQMTAEFRNAIAFG